MTINLSNNGAEYVSLLMLIMIVFLMGYTKPRTTPIFMLDLAGIVLSILEILVHFRITSYILFAKNFNPIRFNIMCIVFYAIYILILGIIFAYVVLLSSKQMKMLPFITKCIFAVVVVYVATIVYIVANDGLYVITQMGERRLSAAFGFYLLFGVVDAVCCIIVSRFNRRTIAKSVYTYIVVFAVMDIFLLVLQMVLPDILFSSVTYVFPFFLFYILFHSNPFDDVSGFQNYYSCETIFLNDVRRKKNNTILYVSIPILTDDRKPYANDIIDILIAERSRSVSEISDKINVYSIKENLYAAIIRTPDEQEALEIIAKVKSVLEEPIVVNGQEELIKFKMVSVYNDGFINTIPMLNAMRHYLFSRLEENDVRNLYICNERDHEMFQRQ